MPSFPNRYAAKLDVFLQCATEEYQFRVLYVPDAALTGEQAMLDLTAQFTGAVRTPIRNCLAADCYIRGYRLSGMCKGFAIPRWFEYAATLYPGTVAGESYSPNCSMLLVGYSAVPTAHTQRRRVSKIFIGPPPESKAAANVVDAAFAAGAVTTLNNAITAPFVGGTSGVTWYRALTFDPVAADPAPPHTPHVIDVVDSILVRQTLFTQRRRVKPIF